MENVSPAYEAEDGRRVEAIARTLMSEFFLREFTDEANERTTLRAMANKGEPRAAQCILVAGVLVNFLREELEIGGFLTDAELKKCGKNPDILRALADEHEAHATEAEAVGLEGCVATHTKRRDELRAEAQRLEDAL